MELVRLYPVQGIPGVEAWEKPQGKGVMFRFPNGYGASIIRHANSYGTELGVVHFADADRESWGLVYDTPITDDVLGWLTPEECAEALRRISELPLRRKAIEQGDA